MALRVLAGPGCDSVGKLDYATSHLESDDDLIISVGRIFAAITETDDVPSSNGPALRLSLYLRTVAIRRAREQELSGFVLTSNGDRAALDRLAAEAGATRIDVVGLSEPAACAMVKGLVPAGQRRAACDEGIRRRWFGRYTPGPNDREVDLDE